MTFELDGWAAQQDDSLLPEAPSVAQAVAEVAGLTDAQLWDRLQEGVRWPKPQESPPFWDRPARDAPLPLGVSPMLPVSAPLFGQHLHVLCPASWSALLTEDDAPRSNIAVALKYPGCNLQVNGVHQ